MSLRQGVAIPGWLCLPSTLADAISNCYREKPCWRFIVRNVYGGWGGSVLYVPLWSQCALWSEGIVNMATSGLDPDCLQKEEEKWSKERGLETQRQNF